MKTIPTAAAATIAGTLVPMAVLIEMQLSTTLRLTLSDTSIEWDGHTWTGLGAAGSMAPIVDTAGERKGISFSLSTVPLDLLNAALEESMVGRTVRVYVLIADSSTYQPAMVDLAFSGTLGQPSITEDEGSGTISVSAESREVTFRRPKPLRYTDADQRRLYPGDTSLRFIASQANHQDVWPSAAWGRK